MARSKAREALQFVRAQAKLCETATDLHNKFFGNGGKFGQLFPTRAEREAFLLTPEYQEIVEIRHVLESPRRKRASARG